MGRVPRPRTALALHAELQELHYGCQHEAPRTVSLIYGEVPVCKIADSSRWRLCAWFDLLQNEDDHVIFLLCVGNIRISAWKAWDISQCYVAKYPGVPPSGQSAPRFYGSPKSDDGA